MITAANIASACGEAIAQAATQLRPDVYQALLSASKQERSPRGCAVLGQLIENAHIASNDDVPLCQDTGTVWVRIELGEGEYITGDIQSAIDDRVGQVYREQGLRMSVVHDALVDRTNTDTNAPAFIDVVQRRGPGVTVHVMLKGAGSDNASRVEMLNPDQGFEGIKTLVLDVVRTKASMACPPLVIGVGVGATFDKVGSLAKKALLRDVGAPNKDARIAEFESELLCAVNQTGMGPAGLGGDTTALGIAIETAPCHIAALPVAINMGCSAMRSRSVELECDEQGEWQVTGGLDSRNGDSHG